MTTTYAPAGGGKIWDPQPKEDLNATPAVTSPMPWSRKEIALFVVGLPLALASAVAAVLFSILLFQPSLTFEGNTFTFVTKNSVILTILQIGSLLAYLFSSTTLVFPIIKRRINEGAERFLVIVIAFLLFMFVISIIAGLAMKIAVPNSPVEQLKTWTYQQLGVTDQVATEVDTPKVDDFASNGPLTGKLLLNNDAVLNYEYTKDVNGNWQVHKLATD